MRNFARNAFECGLWMVLLLTAYGQRDGWRDENWLLFGAASALQGVFVQLLRAHIRSSANPAPDGEVGNG